MRYAVLNVSAICLPTINRYLPDNYEAKWDKILKAIVISGEDVAGWTLDGYVIPRLRSGNYYPKEIQW